jgi:hypothetical protein
MEIIRLGDRDYGYSLAWPCKINANFITAHNFKRFFKVLIVKGE